MIIPKRNLGRTGLQVSCLGFGAAPAAFLNTDQSQLARMLDEMLDAGVNVLDTAAMYPGSEAFIGGHMSKRRKDYVLISKCGSKVTEIDAPPWSVKLISQSVDRALKLLKTDTAPTFHLRAGAPEASFWHDRKILARRPAHACGGTSLSRRVKESGPIGT